MFVQIQTKNKHYSHVQIDLIGKPVGEDEWVTDYSRIILMATPVLVRLHLYVENGPSIVGLDT